MVQFRNINVSAKSPVDEWGIEGLLTAIERGGVREWSRILRAADAAPDSEFRAELDEALALAEGGGTEVIRLGISRMDASWEDRVQREARTAFRMADTTISDFAEQVGTSRSRMSTYLSGKTMPGAVLLLKMQDVGHRRRAELIAR